MWQRSGCPIDFDYPPSQGSWDTWWVMHFSVSIKIKVESQWIRKMLLLCRLASRFLARIETPLCDLVHKGEQCLAAPPSPAPWGSVQILDQVPQDHEEPIWGSADSFKSQTTGRREFLSLAFHTATGWKLHPLNSFWETIKQIQSEAAFYWDRSGTSCCTIRRQKWLYLCVCDSYVRGQE